MNDVVKVLSLTVIAAMIVAIGVKGTQISGIVSSIGSAWQGVLSGVTGG